MRDVSVTITFHVKVPDDVTDDDYEESITDAIHDCGFDETYELDYYSPIFPLPYYSPIFPLP